MTYILEHYNGHAISFRRGDGYVHATALCRANGKYWANYWDDNKETRKWIAEHAETIGIPIEKLIESKEGRGGGTWVHPDIAVDLAMWCSSRCKTWVVLKINELRSRGVISISHDDGPGVAVDMHLGITPIKDFLPPILEAIEDKLDEHRAEQRKRVPGHVRRRLFRVIDVCYDGACPIPNGSHGGSLEVEHMYSRSSTKVEDLWITCRDHNLWKEHISSGDRQEILEPAFKIFQQHRRRLEFPLLYLASEQPTPIPALPPRQDRLAFAASFCVRCHQPMSVDEARCRYCGLSESMS